MIKTILFSLLFAVAAFAQRTPLKINGTIVNNPNFTNTASLSWAVTGSDIRGTAAGGGDTLWTNDNGTIRSTSTVVDGGTAFALVSSNAMSSGVLLGLTNLTTNAFQVTSGGGIRSGFRGGEFTDFSLQLNPGLHALYIAELYNTENATADVTLQSYGTVADLTNDVRNATWDILSSINFSGEPVSFMEGYVRDASGVISDFFVNVKTNDVEHSISVSGTTRFLAHPSISDGSTPYFRDTSIPHSSGYLDEVRNNGTNKAGVLWDGSLTISGQTNQLSVAAGALLLDGSPVGGGGGITNTVINTGTPAIGNVPYYTDTTGTNIAPLTTGFYSGAILTPWVGTNNAVSLQWKKAPVVYEFTSMGGEWTTLTANSGSGSVGTGPPDNADIGAASGTTGTLTNGVGGVRGPANAFYLPTNSMAVMMRVNIPSALSTDADGYQIIAGIGDSAGDAEPNDGAYFFYSHSTSNGVWTAKTSKGASRTFASGAPTTPPTVTASVWYNLLVEGNKDVANFWVSLDDGVTWQWIGYSTGNLPNDNTRYTGIQAYIRKVGGSTGTTSRTFYLGHCLVWPNRGN